MERLTLIAEARAWRNLHSTSWDLIDRLADALEAPTDEWRAGRSLSPVVSTGPVVDLLRDMIGPNTAAKVVAAIATNYTIVERERIMIARLTVQRGDLTEFPLAEKVEGGWQNGVTHYPDADVIAATELYMRPRDTDVDEREALMLLLTLNAQQGVVAEADEILAAGFHRATPNEATTDETGEWNAQRDITEAKAAMRDKASLERAAVAAFAKYTQGEVAWSEPLHYLLTLAKAKTPVAVQGITDETVASS